MSTDFDVIVLGGGPAVGAREALDGRSVHAAAAFAGRDFMVGD